MSDTVAHMEHGAGRTCLWCVSIAFCGRMFVIGLLKLIPGRAGQAAGFLRLAELVEREGEKGKVGFSAKIWVEHFRFSGF